VGGVTATAILVGLGGALGTLLRWGTSLYIARQNGSDGSWGTFIVNVVGSFAIGMVAETLAEQRILGTQAHLILGTGILGGFTTYSSFNLETVRLLERGEFGKAVLYAGTTFVACLFAGLGGLALGRALKAT
jgi:CrcB protein